MPNTTESPMEIDSDSETFTGFGFYDVPKNNINASPVTYGPYEKLIVSDWKQCGLHLGIIQAFDKMNIKEMTSIQKHCAFYLMSNLNTAIVGAAKGKSISYLTHILSSMLFDISEMNTLIVGPNVIILTNSLDLCVELANLINALLSLQIEEINVMVVDPFVSESILETRLINGCNILISTPSNLDRFLKQIKCFSWFNLRYFVFENLDVLLNDYGDEMATILKLFTEMKNRFTKVQLVSTSVRWTKNIDEFLKKMFNLWQYIFGCHLEAARYINIEFYVVHLKLNKLKMISWYLKNNFKRGRIVLISSNTDELSVIHRYIQEFNSDINALLADPNQSDLTVKKWNNPLENNQRLLICSDDMMFDHYIDNADYLIHYDIPAKEFKFEERFSFLQDSNNMLKKNKSSSYAFLCEVADDMSMMPKVVETMKYFDDVDTILQQVAKKEINIQEKEKTTFICNKLLQFGDCPEQLSCKNRHILTKDLDQPANNVPMSGLAEIQILHIYDASHMTAKLLNLNCTNSLTDTGNWYQVQDNSKIIKRELSLYYLHPEFRINLENLRQGDKVTVELESNTTEVVNSEYFRAMVIDIIDKNTLNSKVLVKLLDTGMLEIVPKWKIFVLPYHLAKLNTTTVDVFLLSVKPAHFDTVWYPKADEDVKEKIMSVNPVIVDIQFSLGNAICISKMYSKWFSPTLNKCESETILPDMLFRGNYCIENSLHYDKLKGLILSAGITSLHPLEENKFEDISDKLNIERTMPNFNNLIEWAFLDEALNLVEIRFFTNPKFFFVRNVNTADELCGLHIYINDSVEQKEVVPFKKIIEGAIGLAYHEETNQFCRIKILKIINDTLAEVFFVDYGEFDIVERDLIFTILPFLIKLLPFQAIECSLHDIKKVATSGIDLVNTKFRLNRGPLHVEIVDVKANAKFTDGCHYKVVVYDDECNINSVLRKVYHNYINVVSDDISSGNDDSIEDVDST